MQPPIHLASFQAGQFFLSVFDDDFLNRSFLDGHVGGLRPCVASKEWNIFCFWDQALIVDPYVKVGLYPCLHPLSHLFIKRFVSHLRIHQLHSSALPILGLLIGVQQHSDF